MFESMVNFFKKMGKQEKEQVKSKDAAKERLHLVLMQDRANVSADFLDLMKQEIIEVIKKYIDVDENAIDVRLTSKSKGDGMSGAPALYANIPIVSIKEDVKNGMARQKDTKQEVNNQLNVEPSKEIVQDKQEKVSEQSQEEMIQKQPEEVSEQSQEEIIQEQPEEVNEQSQEETIPEQPEQINEQSQEEIIQEQPEQINEQSQEETIPEQPEQINAQFLHQPTNQNQTQQNLKINMEDRRKKSKKKKRHKRR